MMIFNAIPINDRDVMYREKYHDVYLHFYSTVLEDNIFTVLEDKKITLFFSEKT